MAGTHAFDGVWLHIRATWMLHRLRCSLCRELVDPQREIRCGVRRFCSLECACAMLRTSPDHLPAHH
jgi:hypothetical protein